MLVLCTIFYSDQCSSVSPSIYPQKHSLLFPNKYILKCIEKNPKCCQKRNVKFSSHPHSTKQNKQINVLFIKCSCLFCGWWCFPDGVYTLYQSTWPARFWGTFYRSIKNVFLCFNSHVESKYRAHIRKMNTIWWFPCSFWPTLASEKIIFTLQYKNSCNSANAAPLRRARANTSLHLYKRELCFVPTTNCEKGASTPSAQYTILLLRFFAFVVMDTSGWLST